MSLVISTTFRRGTKTRQVLTSIAEGCCTLKDIASATGLQYREVNAFVASLEKQSRISVENPSCRRKDQRFRVKPKVVERSSEWANFPMWLVGRVSERLCS